MVAEARVELEHGEYGALTGIAITGFGVWEPADSSGELRVDAAGTRLPIRRRSGTVWTCWSQRTRNDQRNRSRTPSRDGWTALGETSGTVTI